MLNQGTRRFDLYDFFSIFIPGASAVIALFPFVPAGGSVPLSGVIGVVVVGGFVIGRGIHATALWVEGIANATTHRELFIDEVINPNCVSDELATQFYSACHSAFDTSELPKKRDDLGDEHRANLEDLYTLVRSYVHIDGRGRSRTFQAVLDFYRSIWVASFMLALVYMFYGTLTASGILSPGIIRYQSYLGTLGIHYSFMFYGAVAVVGGAYGTFRRVRSDYREYFVQYLFSDFVVLEGMPQGNPPSGGGSLPGSSLPPEGGTLRSQGQDSDEG